MFALCSASFEVPSSQVIAVLTVGIYYQLKQLTLTPFGIQIQCVGIGDVTITIQRCLMAHIRVITTHTDAGVQIPFLVGFNEVHHLGTVGLCP